jgi:hypothetical protein
MKKEEKNKEKINPGVRESLTNQSNRTTKFVCKVCGAGFEDDVLLNSHTAEAHHPKRTVTINDIVSIVFDGALNLPKTKAEIVKEAERNKNNKPEITPEIIDILRNLPDKRFNDQADLAHAIQTTMTAS